MPQVSFRFYAELNEHLPCTRRQIPFIHTVYQGATVGIAVESPGVPASQMDLVLVNGASTGLTRELHDGDCLSVYPVFESFDITSGKDYHSSGGIPSSCRTFPWAIPRRRDHPP